MCFLALSSKSADVADAIMTPLYDANSRSQTHALLVMSRVSKGIYRAGAARRPVDAVRRHLETIHLISKVFMKSYGTLCQHIANQISPVCEQYRSAGA